MSGIHDAVLNYVKDRLQVDLIDNLDPSDTTIAGVVKIGPLQGDPDPDVARISVELYASDPDREIKGSGLAATEDQWDDQPYATEIGGGILMKRRFTAKCRCLFDHTGEDLATSVSIVSTVRNRIERSILSMSFSGVSSDDGEIVGLSPISGRFYTEQSQGGGPSAYDFNIKFRFEVVTEQIITLS